MRQIKIKPLENKKNKINSNEKLQSLKKLFINWSLKSTCYAFASIFRVKKIYLKLIWLILLAVSFGICNFLVIQSILAFFGYEVITKIRMVEERPLVFPTISICQKNPFNLQNAQEFILDFLIQNMNIIFKH